MLRSLYIVALLSIASAQVTYTGCHNESVSTALVEWCYGPNASETPLLTFTTSTPSTMMTSTQPASVLASPTTTGQTTAITGCHSHELDIYCINGNGQEVLVSITATPTGSPPAQYTGCHTHGSDYYCMDPNGVEVLVITETSESHNHESGEEQEMDCHFHAGVEHCVPVGQSETSNTASCERRDRDYNVPVRVGTLFAVLATSAIGVFLPLLVGRFASGKLGINSLLFTFLKQFGTGVIIATAFVHLCTHASLMFNNQCLGRLSYEATTSAVVMAGVFVSFALEYASRRFLGSYISHDTRASQASTPDHEESGIKQPVPQTTVVQLGHHGFVATGNTKLSVTVLEAGILFHSLILGLTLVVAGDSAYITLFIVIVFHQFFEGLALGSRIASLPSTVARMLPTKVTMAAAFALITPLGMAIGIGVLQRFNGNDPSTIIAIGTLDAVSAGILIWVGVVEMWAADWAVPGGDLFDASLLTVSTGAFGLISGLLLMSVLGKWA